MAAKGVSLLVMKSAYISLISVVRFDPLLQGQTRIAKLKIAYNSLIIGPTGLGW